MQIWGRSRQKLALLVLTLVLLPAALVSAAGGDREIPKPLPDHPGNIFVAGEDVSVPLAGGEAWSVIDYDGNTVIQGKAENGHAALGKLPPGYYELHVAGARCATIGVLMPLVAPTPETSPISIDVAMAWFYDEVERPGVASLSALAGINWVRDRLAWKEMEPAKGRFVGLNKYDDTAHWQSAAGLKVLQVHHDSPCWANQDTKRFPLDLRDAFAFQREMARRWKGKVRAFEPWNEADIGRFGGHTGAEMAALQKASYLGLKAGNSDVIACMNVFALAQPTVLADLNDNEVWPYFDTFNFHHYTDTDAYPGIYSAFRTVSAGQPLWVSECNVPVHWSGDVQMQEPSETDLRLQAERVARVYASSLHEGSGQVFYFLLPHYCEGDTQFGVLHKDLTPRPAFLALGACGRLLAGAKPLGKLPTSSPWLTPAGQAMNAFVFRAWPDGEERDVLVAWTPAPQAHLGLAVPLAVYDHLGRAKKADAGIALTRAPVFVVFPKDTFRGILLQPPPPAPTPGDGKPSPIVLQALWPKDRVMPGRSAYGVSSEKRESIPVFVYNFGTNAVSGTLRVMAPAGWVVHLPVSIEIQPSERKELALNIDCRGGSAALVETLKIKGDFGASGTPVLSVRLMPLPGRDK